MSELLTCNMCEDREERFQCPYDKVGIALMSEHLRDKHGIEADVNLLPYEER